MIVAFIFFCCIAFSFFRAPRQVISKNVCESAECNVEPHLSQSMIVLIAAVCVCVCVSDVCQKTHTSHKSTPSLLIMYHFHIFIFYIFFPFYYCTSLRSDSF